MKKFFFLLTLGAAAATVQAQNTLPAPTSSGSTGGSIPAGTISIGGSIGFNTSTNKVEYKLGSNNYTDEITNSEFRFSPAVGYFLADNLAVGLSLGYTANSSKVTNTGPGRTSPNALDASTTLRVGPYVQYYHMLSDQFGVLGTLSAGYQNSFTPSSSGNNVIETKGSGFYAALTPGIIFFPIPKFGISASIGNLGYNRLTTTRSNDTEDRSNSTSSFGAGFGFDQLMFGGTFFLGR